MGVQQYGSQHVSSNTDRRRSYEVQLRQVILLTSYGTCLHVAGSVGDKPGPGSRRVLINKKEKRSVVLIIHSAGLYITLLSNRWKIGPSSYYL